MQKGLYEEKLVHSSVLVVTRSVLMRRYQCFGAVIEVSNIVERGVNNDEL